MCTASALPHIVALIEIQYPVEVKLLEMEKKALLHNLSLKNVSFRVNGLD